MAGCATPTSSAGHAPAGATANAKLTFKSDHQAGAGQSGSSNLNPTRARSGAAISPIRVLDVLFMGAPRQVAHSSEGHIKRKLHHRYYRVALPAGQLTREDGRPTAQTRRNRTSPPRCPGSRNRPI